MNKPTPHILLLEPYFGGSHRAFLEGLQANIPFQFTLVSLPARKWKMRMQLAAPWMAEKVIQLVENGLRFDAILCSTFLDVATLRVLLVKAGISLPVAVYFHENQFAYPNQESAPGIYQFSALNFTSALAADSLAFNSNFNRDTFLAGVTGYLKKATDMDISENVKKLSDKSIVLYPGIDFSIFDSVESMTHKNEIPVIVWNHRWEHDKDPVTFFETMIQLSGEGYDFQLIVLGQHFERCPEIFSHARSELDKHIIHFGYVPDKYEYARLLHKADIVVSTAIHEFFGMAVLEAVRCGCRPFVPDRLAYRELFPDKYKYREGEFVKSITSLLNHHEQLKANEINELTVSYSWSSLTDNYKHWFSSMLL